jgi:tetratricopeptide (TPR) repeat protein
MYPSTQWEPNQNERRPIIKAHVVSSQWIPVYQNEEISDVSNELNPVNKWTSKEGLIILSLILVCIFSFMEIIFFNVWLQSNSAFQVLSNVIFIMFIVILIAGAWLYLLERKRIFALEREGLIFFIIGSSLTIFIPIFSATTGVIPAEFFENFAWSIYLGVILILIGVVLVAWFGGFFSIWFFGLLHYIVMSSHEAYPVYIYTYHFGPYDQYYGILGLALIIISIILLFYHELKFLYLGKLIKHASDLRRNGRYQEALKPLKHALKLYPRYATAWNNKGNVLFNLGYYKEAMDCYNRALKLSPGYKIAELNLNSVRNRIRI